MTLPAWMKRKAAKATDTINSYRRLFSTEDGRAVIKDLMRSCHYHSSTLGSTPQETAYNEGMRAVVIRIFQTMNLTTEEVLKISQQMNAEEKDIFEE